MIPEAASGARSTRPARSGRSGSGGPTGSSSATSRNAMKSAAANAITIDAGGQIFRTARSTLQQVPNLAALAETARPGAPIFLDRAPDLFADILQYLRTGEPIRPRSAAHRQRLS